MSITKLTDKFSAGATPKADLWADIPDEKWNSWRWQMSHRLKSLEELSELIALTPEEIEGMSAKNKFRIEITPFFASLIDPNAPHCPIRQQVIPKAAEQKKSDHLMDDSLAEEKYSPVRGLIHRYPDRALMLTTTQCASYCRFCTRSRIVGNPKESFNLTDFEQQLEYLKKTAQIRDVLLSGGDPLMLPLPVLERLLSELRKIEHIEIIRIGSRMPVFLPHRIDDELIEVLAKYRPLWLNIHVNHPDEITPELTQACDRLTRAGIPLGNQSVLLAGINDSLPIQRKLIRMLVQMNVRPYYLYQCDLIQGGDHFRTSISKGIEIMEGLQGHTSGYAIPKFVVDAPGGGGKIPVSPQYLISQGTERSILRNFEGFITTYHEPKDYDPKVIQEIQCKSLNNLKSGQEGISELLEGTKNVLVPSELENTRKRQTTLESSEVSL